MRLHGIAPKADIRAQALELLAKVGISHDMAFRYPHEFSGGQRQRICIARALAVGPELLICDEPVSALDVSIQAQVINLLVELQQEFSLANVFISHDLAVVGYVSHRVAVMYLGEFVETGDKDQIYNHPMHPYTQALMSAAPVPDPVLQARRQRIVLSGDVPSPANPPAGCRFHTRCWKAQPICSTDHPPLIMRGEDVAAHPTACHFAEEMVEVVTG